MWSAESSWNSATSNSSMKFTAPPTTGNAAPQHAQRQPVDANSRGEQPHLVQHRWLASHCDRTLSAVDVGSSVGIHRSLKLELSTTRPTPWKVGALEASVQWT